ncbi:MAG: hypothetical protein JST11_30445 [Acidobacteria bacterium]|nr:hypothetical protein [Acidobacteriota bacterium]
MSARYLIPLPALLLLASCVTDRTAGPMQYDSQTVDAQGAASVHVALHMGAGDLRATDGATQLMRADFAYNVPGWKPRVRYTKSGDRGTLIVEQPSGEHSMGNTRYTWDLQFNNKIPIEMEVHFGAGKARLDLGSLDLRGVEVHMGVGEADLDLRGQLRHSYNVTVNGGIGQATLHVPSDAGIWAEAHGGIGSIQVRGLRQVGDHYESESYATAANRMHIEAHGGIGEIRIIAD